MQVPLVSIVMPCHNAEPFIAYAILSVIRQTYANWELLVIDDCSCDGSLSIIEHFAARDHRIKILKNSENRGVALSRNAGIQQSQGTYIAFLDADDAWSSYKLQKQIAFMLSHRCPIAYTAHIFINEKGKTVGRAYCPPKAVSYKKLFHANVLCCSSVMVQSNVMKRHLFDPLAFHEDFAAWLRILQEVNFAYGLTEPLTEYRIMNSTKSADKFKSAKATYDLYRKTFKFSIFKSSALFCMYAINGARKFMRRWC